MRNKKERNFRSDPDSKELRMLLLISRKSGHMPDYTMHTNLTALSYGAGGDFYEYYGLRGERTNQLLMKLNLLPHYIRIMLEKQFWEKSIMLGMGDGRWVAAQDRYNDHAG